MPGIEDYAVLGDPNTAAPVSTAGHRFLAEERMRDYQSRHCGACVCHVVVAVVRYGACGQCTRTTRWSAGPLLRSMT